jgi:hypothetical protein
MPKAFISISGTNDYLKQKQRHYSASPYYKLPSKILLFSLNFMQFMSIFWIFNPYWICENKNLLLFLCLMNLMKLTSIQIFIHQTCFKLPVLFRLLGEYILLCFQFWILPYSIFKAKEWK